MRKNVKKKKEVRTYGKEEGEEEIQETKKGKRKERLRAMKEMRGKAREIPEICF